MIDCKQLMDGKKGLVLGVANEHSLAWAIARKLYDSGATCGFTYQNERTASWVLPLFEQVGSPFAEILDVTDPEAVAEVVGRAGKALGRLDFVVHAIAGGPRKEDLSGRYVDTSPEGFVDAVRVSVYSLALVLRAAEPAMPSGAAAVTLSAYGAQKVYSNYNVMGVAKAALESSVRYLAADLGPQGIRVNAISASPVPTRAASGITGYTDLEDVSAARSLLQRNATRDETAAATVFMLSPLAGGITGQTIFVDGGFSAVGLLLETAR